MLSLPDLEQKRIVFIPSYGKIENILKIRNNNICLYRDGKLQNKISCAIVISLYIVGEFTLTSKMIKKLKEYGISIFMLNHSFAQYADIMAVAEGNYKLRSLQYKITKKRELELAKIIISNKIINQFSLLKQYKRSPDKELYKNSLEQLQRAKTLKSILGIEGNYASYYFSALFDKVGWYRRAPRTKEDIPNFMLDIGYTYLFNFVDSLLKLFGFDTYKGIYHQLFFQRKSLACDIMEPFRSLVDKQLIKSYNLKQINEKDFGYRNGSFYFKKYEFQKKYSRIWFDLIMDNKKEIYQYVLDYYRYFMNSEKYKSPFIKLS
jgi:CRISP-associated protein Cas1